MLHLTAVAGANRKPLPSRIGHHTLKPGSYRLTIGSRSARFTVRPPARKRHRS